MSPCFSGRGDGDLHSLTYAELTAALLWPYEWLILLGVVFPFWAKITSGCAHLVESLELDTEPVPEAE